MGGGGSLTAQGGSKGELLLRDFVRLAKRVEEEFDSLVQGLEQAWEEFGHKGAAILAAASIGASIGLWLGQGVTVNIHAQVNIEQNIQQNIEKIEIEKAAAKEGEPGEVMAKGGGGSSSLRPFEENPPFPCVPEP